jgi:tetratricopeptide (TPR) repeat protein
MRQLALCLATVGRHEEAQLQTAVAARLFPEDPSFTIVSAVSMSMQGDLAAAEQALLPLEVRIGKDAMRQLSDYLTMINRFGELLPYILNGGEEFLEAEGLAQALLGQGYAKNQLLANLQLQAPRCLLNAFGSFGSILRIQADDASGFLAAAAILDRAAEGHPDGLLYFVAAMPYVDQGKYSEAEQRYGKAARTPFSFPSVYPHAVFGAMMCAVAAHGQTGDEEVLKRAVEWAKKRLSLGNLDPVHFRNVSHVLVRGGELEMGLDVAEEAVRSHADNVDLLLNAADLAMRAGHFARALELASQLLDRVPDHQGAAGIRARATEELAKLIESKDIPE